MSAKTDVWPESFRDKVVTDEFSAAPKAADFYGPETEKGQAEW